LGKGHVSRIKSASGLPPAKGWLELSAIVFTHAESMAAFG
jgi:hypothetical protein